MSSFNPRIDLAFKKIFGVEENKDLLMSLINSIVSEADQVADIDLLNPYNIQNFPKDKLSILDIKARGFDGKYFNIEIQIADVGEYDKRALYYWAKIYAEQLQEGDSFKDLHKVIGIHILNFFSIPESQSYHNVFHITEKDKGFKYFNNFELHTIELKKFQGLKSKELSDLVSKINTALDMWVAFLTRHELLEHQELPNSIPQKKQLNKALKVLEIMSFSRLERDFYEGQVKWLMDEQAAIYTAEKKGEERGFEKGIEKGLQQGKIEIAKNLLTDGFDIEKIASITGLDIKDIQEIK